MNSSGPVAPRRIVLAGDDSPAALRLGIHNLKFLLAYGGDVTEMLAENFALASGGGKRMRKSIGEIATLILAHAFRQRIRECFHVLHAEERLECERQPFRILRKLVGLCNEVADFRL